MQVPLPLLIMMGEKIMPPAASQSGLQWQLQPQGGPGRAELSPASCLGLQLLSLIGKLPPNLKLMINAYACVASSSSSAKASPPDPARPQCDAAPARPC